MPKIFTLFPYRLCCLVFLSLSLFLLLSPAELYAQCSAATPVYEVNLDGQPNGSWTSPEVSRDGTCCDAPANEKCVQFNITLDDLSGGLQFEITSGPVPSGAMTYQIDCGPSMAVGDSICVTGPGPHELSICMPGGSTNTFTVRSIAAYEPVADANVTGGCSEVLEAPIAFDPTTVEWNDITGGGTYNSYLSCTSGCGTTTVTPDNNPPPYVDYTVCGNSQSAVCTSIPYCDTVRVYFHPPITASISPDPAIICPGTGNVDLIGSATGGSGFYDYFWFDSSGNLLANAQTYTATSVGTYTLEVRNENYPDCTPFTSSVTVTENLSVDAGPDQQICANEIAQLAGAVTAATGGSWSGGAGTFTPDANTLDAQYEPTAEEAAAGSLTLTLTSTGNGSCDPVSDEVLITFYSFDVSISAPDTLCAGERTTLTANISGGSSPYSYAWSSGETTQSISDKPAGTYTVAVTDSENCTFQATATITEVAGPTAFTASTTSSSCGEAVGAIIITSVSGGSSPYTYSIDGTNFQSSATFSGLAADIYDVSVKDFNGCTYTESVVVSNINGPTDLTASATASTCGEANGQIEIHSTTGGVAPYTYSIDGTNFQSETTFTGLASGTYTITVKDNTNCRYSEEITLTDIPGPTAVSASSQTASCTDNDGSLEATSVSGGTSPYTYSIDGTSFQSETTFSGLASGTYTLTARDANGCTISTAVNISKTEPTDLSAALSPSSCGEPNGQLEVTSLTGGVAPYTYSIDGTNFQTSATFSNLLAGTYTVTVMDANNCRYAEEFILTDQPGPTGLSLSSSASTCSQANGELSVDAVTGGTSPYTYSIDGTNFQSSTTFSSLLAGTYTLTVKDANGCLFSEDILVSDIPGPTDFTASTTPSTCSQANGELSIDAVTGGTSPYTYSIDGTNFQSGTTFSGLAAATYLVTVKDSNGCLFAKEVTLGDLPAPTDFTASTTPSTCGDANGSILVESVSGGTAPYTYSDDGTSFQASSTLNGLSAGTYTIVVKDANDCFFSKEVTLSDIPGPTAVSASSQPASCDNSDGSIEVTSVTGGSSPYTYSIDGTNFQTSTTFSGLAYGTYTLTARDSNGCTISSSIVVERIGPTDMSFTIEASSCGSNTGSITVSSVSGGLTPYTYSIDGTNYQTSEIFSALSSGLYTVWVKDANACIYSEEVIVNDVGGATGISTSIRSASCGLANGEISVDAVTGGSAPYTYSLDGGAFQSETTFSGLTAATYNLSVKDSIGCIYAEEVVVGNIPGPDGMNIAPASSTCGDANGSLQVSSVNGGTSPYTYSIDGTSFQSETTFSGLLAGTYTLTVKDANNCSYTQEAILEDIPGPTAMSLSTGSSVCSEANGSLTVESVSGGTSPYTYSIDGTTFQASATFTDMLAGSYEVSVKDVNGCIISSTATIDDIPGPTAVTATAEPATCADNDGSLTVESVSGGTGPYTYSIDNTTFQTSTLFSGLASGSYTLLAKDANGCAISTEVTVAQLKPTAFTVSTVPATCGNSNGAIEVTGVSGGSSPYTYSIDGTNFQSETTFSNLLATTYTLSVKDANGCLYANEVVLENISGPSAITTALSATTCGNANGQIEVTEVNGGTAPYRYSLDGTNFQEAEIFSGLLAGTYTLTVKDTNDCRYAEEVVLENIPAPTDMSLVPTSSACGDANGQISVTAVTGGTSPYTYSIDGINFQTESTVEGLFAGTYTLTVKDANGCTFSGDVVVEDMPGPTGLSASTSPSSCTEANGTIEVETVTGGTSPYSYRLNGGSFQPESHFTGLVAGDYLLQVRDVNGCIYEERVMVTNLDGPTGLSADLTAASCGEANGSIEVTSVTGGNSPYSYSINETTFQSSTTFSGLLPGIYTLSVKDSNGCLYAEGVEVEDAAGVTAISTSIQPSSCTTDNGSIRIESVSGGTAPYEYSLDGSTYGTESSFTGLAPADYTVYVRDANGCVSPFNESVPTNGPQSAETTLTDASCGESNGSISVDQVVGGAAPYTYSIDGSNFQSAASFSGLAAGSYTLSIQDAGGCLLELPLSLSNSGGPEDFTVSLIDASCGESNGSISFSEVSGGTSPYTYSIDGSSYRTESSFTGLAEGIYQLSVQDASGCLLFKTDTLYNSQAPFALRWSTTPATCGEANGSLQTEEVSGGTAPYSWSLDGTNFQESGRFSGLAAGSYTLYVQDANGCTYSEILDLEGLDAPAKIHFSSSNVSCQEEGSIHIIEVTGGTAPYAYSLNGATYQPTPDFTNLSVGSYNLSVKDANNCILSTSVKIVEQAVHLEYIQPVSCYGAADGQIALRTEGGESKPQFSIDGGTTYQSDSVFHNLAPGYYHILASFSDNCNQTLDSLLVRQPDSLYAAVTQTAKAIGSEATGSAFVSEVQGGTPPYAYALDNGSFSTDTVFQQLSGGDHVLTVRDAAGCIALVPFSIELITDLEIPNSFTPNGDGINDSWALKSLSVLYPQCKVAVYNRWGSAVFTSEGYTSEWDGTNKGAKLPDATYYYIIQLSEDDAPLKGSVTIMR